MVRNGTLARKLARSAFGSASLFGAVFMAVACAVDPAAIGTTELRLEPIEPSTLSMSDVSILFPVPDEGTDPLLTPSSSGARGPLLPAAFLSKIGRVIAVASNEDLRVVGARVDPCFPDLSLLETKPDECRRQIRLVLQPYSNSGSFSDAAVHLLYDLEKQDFANMVTELAHLGDRSEAHHNDPLSVHPKMNLTGEGADGPTARAIGNVILRYAGERTLVRVAVMSLDEPDTEWKFKAFNVVGGALVADPIPMMGTLKIQQVTKGLPETGNSFEMEIHPASEHGDKIAPFLLEDGISEIAADLVDSALGAAFFTEHPAKSNPTTIDCATCHIAPNARLFAERVRGLNTSEDPRRYTSSRDLTLTTPLSTQKLPSMRAFGWFGRDAAISPRTVNETAAVLDALSKYGLGDDSKGR